MGKMEASNVATLGIRKILGRGQHQDDLSIKNQDREECVACQKMSSIITADSTRSVASGANQLFASAMTTLNIRPRAIMLATNDNIKIEGESSMTYLEPCPPGVYHPFASRYFAKLPGTPAHNVKKFTTERVAMPDNRNGRLSLPTESTEYCWSWGGSGGLGKDMFGTVKTSQDSADHGPIGGVRGPGSEC